MKRALRRLWCVFRLEHDWNPLIAWYAWECRRCGHIRPSLDFRPIVFNDVVESAMRYKGNLALYAEVRVSMMVIDPKAAIRIVGAG